MLLLGLPLLEHRPTKLPQAPEQLARALETGDLEGFTALMEALCAETEQAAAQLAEIE